MAAYNSKQHIRVPWWDVGMYSPEEVNNTPYYTCLAGLIPKCTVQGFAQPSFESTREGKLTVEKDNETFAVTVTSIHQHCIPDTRQYAVLVHPDRYWGISSCYSLVLGTLDRLVNNRRSIRAQFKKRSVLQMQPDELKKVVARMGWKFEVDKCGSERRIHLSCLTEVVLA